MTSFRQGRPRSYSPGIYEISQRQLGSLMYLNPLKYLIVYGASGLKQTRNLLHNIMFADAQSLNIMGLRGKGLNYYT